MIITNLQNTISTGDAEGIFDRPRLLKFDRGQPIVVVEAPSGYGKTVFARSWIRHAPTECRTYWVSLDAAARDPTVFLERLVASVVKEGLGEGRFALDDEAGRTECLSLIASHLAEDATPVRLVLDDVHHLAGSQSRYYVQKLLHGSSSRLRILVTLQPIELDIGLGGLTTQNKVCWLNGSTLCLTSGELEVYSVNCGRSLVAGQRDALMRATQGWAALIQLALAVAVEHSPLQLKDVAGLGPVREYIYERFLTGLADFERRLVWTLACLGSAPHRLLAAFLGEGSQLNAAITRLSALGIVQPEEPAVEPTVRLHPLVRDSALRVLATEATEKKEVLHAAARWLIDNGYRVPAVRTLLECGTERLDLAKKELLALADPLIFRQGHHQTLLDLVEQWERIAGQGDPALAGIAAWALIFQRRFTEAGIRLDEASVEAHSGGRDEQSLQRAVMEALRDNFETAGQLAETWLNAEIRPPSLHTGAAWTVHAFGLKCSGEIERAQGALRNAHTAFTKAQSVYGTVWACIIGALTNIRVGRHRDALAEIEQGLTRCGDTPGFGGQRAMLGGIESFIRYERDELRRVREILDEVIQLLPHQGLIDTVVLGFTSAARMRAAAGDIGAALDILSEGERSGDERNFRKLSVSLRAESALVLIRAGAIGPANEALDRLKAFPEADDIRGLMRDRTLRLRARLAIAEGDAELARQIVAGLRVKAAAARQQYKLCELLMLTALSEDQLNDEAAAFEALRSALTLAHSESYLRLFLDESAELVDLVGRWLKMAGARPQNRAEAAWAEKILSSDHIAQQSKKTGSSKSTLSLEPLNRRELQLLQLLDEGLTNAEIAARCFVVEGTVKWNLHNLYGKFGVRTRTAAVRFGRENGLLKSLERGGHIILKP